eukprot:12399628-Karenia_brevis.AAC.1
MVDLHSLSGQGTMSPGPGHGHGAGHGAGLGLQPAQYVFWILPWIQKSRFSIPRAWFWIPRS